MLPETTLKLLNNCLTWWISCRIIPGKNNPGETEKGSNIIKKDQMREKQAFQLMIKPVGPACNLTCDYCYYLEKSNIYTDREKTPSRFVMTPEVLEKGIKDYIESQPTDEVHFNWQGGEPLLAGIGFFRRAMALQQKYADGKNISNSIQTNGTLITEEWADFLGENKFLTGISVDGPADLHDHYRTFSSGKGSFGRVMNSIRLLHKYNIEFNTLTVVTDRSSRMPLRVYHFLKDIGSRFMQFIPIVEREADNQDIPLRLVTNEYHEKTRIREESVKSLEWGKFLSRIFDEWVRIDIGNHYVNYFDNTLAPYLDEYPSMCTMQSVCGKGLVLEHNGDLYSCDHYVYPEYRIGNILNEELGEMAVCDLQLEFGRKKQNTLPRQCMECEFLRMCGGDCPKHRFVKNDEGHWISYLHDGLLHFFRHVDKYMKMMAQELRQQNPPASIMNTFPDREKKKMLQRQKYRLT
jgi:uncharacterized protein